MPPPQPEGEPMPYAEILPGYASIGEFYKELQHGGHTIACLVIGRRLTE